MQLARRQRQQALCLAALSRPVLCDVKEGRNHCCCCLTEHAHARGRRWAFVWVAMHNFRVSAAPGMSWHAASGQAWLHTCPPATRIITPAVACAQWPVHGAKPWRWSGMQSAASMRCETECSRTRTATLPQRTCNPAATHVGAHALACLALRWRTNTAALVSPTACGGPCVFYSLWWPPCGGAGHAAACCPTAFVRRVQVQVPLSFSLFANKQLRGWAGCWWRAFRLLRSLVGTTAHRHARHVCRGTSVGEHNLMHQPRVACRVGTCARCMPRGLCRRGRGRVVCTSPGLSHTSRASGHTHTLLSQARAHPAGRGVSRLGAEWVLFLRTRGP
jgi:hypothetical protein